VPNDTVMCGDFELFTAMQI